MSSNILDEIDGIKPNVSLAVDDEHQVKGSGKSVYTLKRREDHYYCTCPAWRNQKGVATDARSCKHLKAFLGEDYEAARIRWKNSGATSGPATSQGATSKAGTKRKATDNNEDGEEQAAVKATHRARKPPSRSAKAKKEDASDDANSGKAAGSRTRKPASTRSAKANKVDDAEIEESRPIKRARKSPVKDDDLMDVDDSTPPSQLQEGSDDLAEINGIKPSVLLKHNEETEVKSASSKSVYKVKRTWDHYYCTCPAWRNQSGVPTEGRTCKHLKSLLGDAYEEARINARNVQLSSSNKPTSKVSKPPSKASKPASNRSKRQTQAEDKDIAGEEEPAKDESDEPQDTQHDDELAEINGHRPKVYLKDGEVREVKSQTSSSTYKIKRTWDHYYCTCMAWKTQGALPTNARTCKHLMSFLGEEYEEARLKWKNPDGPSLDASNKRGGGRGASGKKKAEPPLLLASKWDLEDGPDPTGWWISEKFDGVRTFYDGTQALSRLGNPFTPPQWFLDKMPKDMTLDGEFFGGRNKFQDTVSIVKTKNSPHWKNITFQIFDIPSHGEEPFEKRQEFLNEKFGPGGEYACKELVVVEQTKAKSRDHVLEMLKEIETLGGEGLMLREPGSKYVGSRSSTLLKIKTFYDAEAEVTGYLPGKGKHAGTTGALKCKMASGKTFSAGSGLSDKQRKNPPKIGTIIIYRFQELTRDGVPRFPTFVGEAIDKTEPKDAEIPDHRKVKVTDKADHEKNEEDD